jgi:hypothetical protein
MATKTLTEKIEALPPEKKAEVEGFVDALAARQGRVAGGPGLVERLRARRERLLREHGLFDSLPIIRDLRENGPR